MGYVKKMVELFEMSSCKPVTIPIPPHFMLRAVNESLSLEEKVYMSKIPYSNAVGSLMYATIGTRLDIAYGVSLVSRFMSKPC